MLSHLLSLTSFYFQNFSSKMQGRCESPSDGIQGFLLAGLRTKGPFFMVPVPLAESLLHLWADAQNPEMQRE